MMLEFKPQCFMNKHTKYLCNDLNKASFHMRTLMPCSGQAANLPAATLGVCRQQHQADSDL